MDDKAAMTSADINDLPDSAFAYIESGGTKDSGGKTVPRSLRHFPIHDAAHVRNALARAPQSPFGKQAMPKILAAAKKFGVGQGQKALGEMKAEPMDGSRLDQWLGGKIPRRVLVIPFGGPIPSEKSSIGVDLDGEWFDGDTDLYGPFATLRNTNARLVDWHHDYDPTGMMKGAILGKVMLDAAAEDAGLWGDFWANVGEERRKLIAVLEARGATLYGSSEAIGRAVKRSKSGHIDVWPIRRHTITTSPQNTFAAVPSLKAMLEDSTLADIDPDALKAYMVGLDNPDDSEATPAGRTDDAGRRVFAELAAEVARFKRLRGL